MNQKKLNRIRKDHASLYRKIGSIRERDLVQMARRLGRRRVKRGHEPTYISEAFPEARPITIPSHPGNMPIGTARNILNDLDGDIFLWQEYLDAQD